MHAEAMDDSSHLDEIAANEGLMAKKAKSARGKQKRLSPDDRRREFVAKATEFFSEQGLKCFSCKDAAEAQTVLKAHKAEINLAIVDVRLPKMNGKIVAKTAICMSMV